MLARAWKIHPDTCTQSVIITVHSYRLGHLGGGGGGKRGQFDRQGDIIRCGNLAASLPLNRPSSSSSSSSRRRKMGLWTSATTTTTWRSLFCPSPTQGIYLPSWLGKSGRTLIRANVLLLISLSLSMPELRGKNTRVSLIHCKNSLSALLQKGDRGDKLCSRSKKKTIKRLWKEKRCARERKRRLYTC